MVSGAPIKILWIFDLDDTLFWNERCFSRAFVLFYEYMALRVMPHRSLPYISRIAEKTEEISTELLSEISPYTGKPFGVSIERFPETLVRCYKWLCDLTHVVVDEFTAFEVYRIGTMAFDTKYFEELGLAPRVSEVLDELQARGDALVLLTRGDPRSQREKISVLGLDKWFAVDDTYMVGEKTPDIFRDISSRFPDCVAVSVGNAYKWDIAPALEAGIFGMYIPAESWRGEENDMPITASERFMEAHEISHVLSIRDRIIKMAA